MEAFGKFIAGLVSVFLLIIFRGYVLVKYWVWFILPVFPLREIRIIEAIGLSAFVGFLWYHKQVEKEDEEWWKKILEGFIVVLVLWGMGWIIHKFY